LFEKQGHIKFAFYRSEVDYITLVWGDNNGGLQHLIIRRDEQFQKGK